MRLLSRLADKRKSGAIWYVIFRQSPKVRCFIDDTFRVLRNAMNELTGTIALAASLFALTLLNTADADEVKILVADFYISGGDRWSANVTLKHGDTGWDHYADNWRVVDGEGKLLGDRVLRHPHVDEQPFTRGLRDIKVPEGTTIVYIEAHDKVHGWTPTRLKVDLSKANGGRLRVGTKQGQVH